MNGEEFLDSLAWSLLLVAHHSIQIPQTEAEFEPVFRRPLFLLQSHCTFLRQPSQPAPPDFPFTEPMKPKGMTEAQFLDLLQKVLPKATSDTRLASSIFERVAEEVRLVNRLQSFEKFCAQGSLPDLEPATVAQYETQLNERFGEGNVTITPTEKGDAIAVEIALPDDRKITNRIKVVPPGEAEEEEVKQPFVPFPVALPEDPDLLWILARREDFGPDEAMRALAKIEEEFWATKSGQKAQRDRVEKTFAEFISRVPAAMLADSGMKRHYKEPEPRKTLQRLTGGQAAKAAPTNADIAAPLDDEK
jgi:hypothetical protein